MDTQYNVRTDIFEGPLDLLLSMVEKRKLFINDISLAAVADDFIAYTQKMNTTPLHEATNFLLIAATLMLIKSKSLLPALSLTEEEEESIEDLQERLRQHKIFAELSEYVSSRFCKSPIFPRRHHTKDMQPVFSPDETVTLDGVYAAAMDSLSRVPKKEVMRQASVVHVVSLEEVIENISERVRAHISTSFKEICGDVRSRQEKIQAVVNFLAVLELVKNGTIHASQAETFADIEMKENNHAVKSENMTV